MSEELREALLARVHEAARRDASEDEDLAANLKQHLSHAFEFPPHLRAALSRWIDGVERRHSGSGGGLHRRVEAVEKSLAEHHDALVDIHNHLVANPSPPGVRKALEDVEIPPGPAGIVEEPPEPAAGTANPKGKK
jgi:hypothetical protein